MLIQSKVTLVVFLLFFAVSAWNIRPLRAGTIDIRDKDIREVKSFTRTIDLQLSKTDYEKWKDLDVIASITLLKMDDTLNFYFDYNIFCPDQGCSLNFTFIRKSEQVNPNFRYKLSVDYLVARGLRISDLNFTSYQEHLMIGDLTTYDENNQPENLVNKIPINNRDALRLLLIPNGWSNMTRTGGIVYLYAMGNDNYMYVVHYMEDKSVAGHDNGDSMGWPEGVDHIKYKVLYFDYDYEPAEGCFIQDKWTLEDHYQSICKKGGKDLSWFYAFKRTKEFIFQGEFFSLRSGYSFSLAKSPSQYGLMAFPFTITQEFIDLRKHEYKYQSEFLMIGQTLAFLLMVAAVVFSGMFLYRITRRGDRDKHLRQVNQKYDVSEGDLTPNSGLTTQAPSNILK